MTAVVTDLAFAPAHALAAAVRRRELAPVELVAASLARIERLNPTLNAFVALRAEEALAEARALGERIARGEDPGPLAGLPFGVKDLEDVAGLPTTHGSVPFRNHVARADSTQGMLSSWLSMWRVSTSRMASPFRPSTIADSWSGSV